MSLLDSAPQLTTLANALTAMLAQVRAVLAGVRSFTPAPTPTMDYETLRLELLLDIRDAKGRLAILERRQQIRTLVADTGVLRDLVWGEGRQLARYRCRGATRLGVRREGSRQAVLLALPSRPGVGERTIIESRRLIVEGLTADAEYCEAMLERPTERLGITVRFPRRRPPRDAILVTGATGEPDRRLAVHFDASGRALLTWRCRAPALHRTYSLRWTW